MSKYWSTPCKVSEGYLNDLFEEIYKNPQTIIIVDLSSQIVKVEDKNLESSFEINAYKKIIFSTALMI